MSEDRRMTTDRFYGGVAGRLQNLQEMLDYVAEESPTYDDLVSWVIDHTQADSKEAVSHHLSFLEAIELIVLDEAGCHLGGYGEQYYRKNDPEILYEALSSGVKGFDLLLKALEEEALTDEEIRELLVSEFEEAEMETSGPAARHREWLQALGFLGRENGENRLTEAGKELLESSRATADIDQSTLHETSERSVMSGTDSEQDADIYMARGSSDDPFHRHISRSLGYYLTRRKRRQLQEQIKQSDWESDDAENLISLLDSDQVTVWGAKNTDRDRQIFESMDPGDAFLMRPGSRNIEYLQKIDQTVGQEAPLELRQSISEEIWTGPDYEFIWFSESPMNRLQIPESEFEEFVGQARSDFTFDDWFPSQGINFTRVNDDVLSHFGGGREFLDALTGLSEVWEQPRTPTKCFALDVRASNVDVRETHRFEVPQRTTDNISALLDAENDARVLLFDGEGIFAAGRLGTIMGSRGEDGLLKEAEILDWVEMAPISIARTSIIDDGLDTWTDGESETIIPITALDTAEYLDIVEEDPLEVDPLPVSNRPDPEEGWSDRAPYYWVNQGEGSDEIDGEYLQAPADDQWEHDLGKLEPEDLLFHYTSGNIIAYSRVEETARSLTYVNSSGERIEGLRVEVDLSLFDPAISFASVFEDLIDEDAQTEKYYPVNHGGINQGYLFNISEAAKETIISQHQELGDTLDRPVLDHSLGEGKDATVWRFSVSASDWLTILRRGALHLWDKEDGAGHYKTEWQQTEPGDVVIFHVTKEDKGGSFDVEPAPVLEENGIIGFGIVDRRARKTDLIWRNEENGLEYPYLVEFDRCFVTSLIEEIDFSRPLFEYTDEEVTAEFTPLVHGRIPWSDAIPLWEDEIGRAPNHGILSYGEVAETASECRGLLHQLVNRMSLREVPVQDLPAMLPPPRDSESVSDQEFRENLEEAKQLVLYGPPGTGKTYTAQQFSRWWLHQKARRPSERRVRMTTFHPAYSYEDFIEGLSAGTTDTGQVKYEYERGIFKRVVEDAWDAYNDAQDPENAPAYVLIIDEINRGELPQILGETITLLEADKRGDATVELAHSGEEFSIPPNLHLIGTMNTADRSISLVDAALRRRFRFIDQPPDLDVLYDHFDIEKQNVKTIAEGTAGETKELQALSILAVEQINEYILGTQKLGKGKQVGHSYLMDEEPMDRQQLRKAWRYEILPLLEEYFFGQFDQIESELFGGSAGALLDVEKEQIRDFDADELTATLRTLVTDED